MSGLRRKPHWAIHRSQLGSGRTTGRSFSLAKRRKVREQPEQLVARVLAIEASYFLLVETLGNDRPADEEAIFNLTGKICWISRRHKQHLGRDIEISLITSQRLGEASSRSRLFGSVSIGKKACGAYVYLPAISFYGLSPFINLCDCMIDLDFEPTKWGHGDLRSISISSLRQLMDLPGFPHEDLVGGDVSVR